MSFVKYHSSVCRRKNIRNHPSGHPQMRGSRKCDIFTKEYYVAIEKEKTLPFVMTWMDIKSIMLNEIRQRKTNTI